MSPTSPSTAASSSHHTLGGAARLRSLTSWAARLLAAGALSAFSGCAALAGSAERGQVLLGHGEASHAGVAMPDPRRTPGAIFPGASRASGLGDGIAALAADGALGPCRLAPSIRPRRPPRTAPVALHQIDAWTTSERGVTRGRACDVDVPAAPVCSSCRQTARAVPSGPARVVPWPGLQPAVAAHRMTPLV